ncbi:MAG: hypothetical protein JNM94_16590 [Phycisphaerae bacterium]|nr:hypothetical protein [Phycisphaerae bacterium]
MKIKGISFVEQHIEKFVAGGFALVFVGVVGMQFLTSPNSVSLNGKDVPPAQIEPELSAKAETVRSRLSEASGARLRDDEPPRAFDGFKSALDSGVSPRRELPPTQPALLASLLPGDVSTGEKPYHVPKFAAPFMVGVFQESDTLDTTVVQQNPELSKRFPSEPYDITWTYAVGEIDLKGLRAELRKGNPNANPPVLPIPPLWFNDSLYIVDMVFERQERKPDGTWGETTTVAVLPGSFTFRPLIPKADANLRQSVFTEFAQRDRILAVLQPDFLPTKGNSFSSTLILGAKDNAPTNAAGSNDADEVRSLRRQASRLADDVARVEEELKPLGGPLEEETPEQRREREKRERDAERGTGSGGSGGGGGGGGVAPPGGGGLGGGQGPGKRQGSGDAEENKQKRRQLTKKLNTLKGKLDKINAQLAKLAPGQQVQAGTVNAIDLSKDESVFVWAHDIDVVTGGTYRYRCRADLLNPFFARKRQLVKEQAGLADNFVMASAVSEWGEPITVQPSVSFFVTDASPGDGRLGLGYAKVEVYRFFDGQRRSESFTVQPGDRIGGKSERAKGGATPVDFTTDWYVVDIVESGGGDRDNRAGTRVVVRRIDESGSEVRTPSGDTTDSDRTRYQDEVTSARVANDEPKDDRGDRGGNSGNSGGGLAPPGPGPGPGGGGAGGDAPSGPGLPRR